MTRNKLLFRLGLPVAIALVAAAIAIGVISHVDWVGRLERDIQLSNKKQKLIRPSHRILVVEITPDCIETFGGNPASGARFVDVDRFLTSMEARAQATILLDIVFTRKTVNENDPGADPEGTKIFELLKGLKNIKVVPGMIFIDRIKYPELHDRLRDDDEPNGIKAFTRATSIWRGPSSERVHPGYIENIKVHDVYAGMTLARFDHRTSRQILCAPLAALLLADGLDPRELVSDVESRVAKVGSHSWILDGNGGVQAMYTRDREPFERIRFAEALDRLERGDVQDWHNRIVLLGQVGFGSDVVDTTTHGEMDGVWYLAHMVNTLEHLKDGRAYSWPLWVYNAIVFAIGLVVSLAVLSGKKLIAIVAPIVVLLAIACAPWLMAATTGYAVETITPGIAFTVSLVIATTMSLTLGFNRDLRVAGQKLSGTVLFGDVIDSTPNLVAKGAEAFQNEMKLLHDACRRLVEQHGGTIERTLGDGFIATFYNERNGQNNAERACQCAMAIVDAIDGLQEDNKTSLSMCFGFESGDLTGQFVKEGGHRNWTSTGEAVVVAQRVQSECKSQQALVLAGPTAMSLLDRQVCIDTKVVNLKGFSDSMAIHVLRSKS